MLQKYLTELKKIKMLSPEEERELWIREEEGDEAAHQKLISSYQPLVFKTAVQFHMPEEITLELIQEGTVGLLEAAESYDYTKGVAFSLYAVHRIRGRMCDFMNREFSRDELSLDRETAEGWSLAEFIPGLQLLPEELAERHAVSYRVSQAIDRLPQKEKLVLQGIFLENKTPSVLAADIKVTPGHIYRLEKQGVRRIRGMLSRFMRDFKK
ncbi:RNA polymerase sporulation-specific sigma factor [Succiniclasticum ruminis]|uniref:RNA polymerase sporulation-specific sigma factor n=1 Tax=Succiniclasticum ruminis TaxID=40841 RepID=A0A1G6HWM1_9FIRM|nr:sigma-70 family RNA polymerase sigma factor [Succiniclasticum ruminis]SDB98604.1 RNA polymerase sporulation-specific sigma factor [Succiniclasticum ruminis]